MKVKEYHNLEKYTEPDTTGAVQDYQQCMIIASKRIGLTDVVVYSDGRQDYQGAMDIHLEAKLNGEDVYFYLKQYYGSCSYCDWIQSASEEEVIKEYIKNLKQALELE